VAEARWGDAGYYRVAAVMDPDVARGIAAFAKADALTGPAASPTDASAGAAK
jgi:hypothetical protein